MQASSANSRDLAVTVPFDAAVTLRVATAHLKVSDQNGNPVSAAGADHVAPPGIPGLPGPQ